MDSDPEAMTKAKADCKSFSMVCPDGMDIDYSGLGVVVTSSDSHFRP